MKFTEIPYERADTALLTAKTEQVTEKISSASDAKTVLAALREFEDATRRYETMATVAYVRHTVDTRDEFYEKENDFYDEFGPLFQEKTQNLMLAVYSSPFRKELADELGEVFFKDIELMLKGFKPEIIPLMQEENRLSSEYQKLYASTTVEMDGEILPLTKLAPYKTSPDREVRKKAYMLEGEYFENNREKYDLIFDKLVKCRTEQAKALGFDNFVQLGYIRRGRNCYTAEDVEVFRRQVREVLVPIVCRVKKEQSERIGIADMKLYDDPFIFKDGNPTPKGTPEELLECARKMYTSMSKETAEFIDAMFEMEMFDLVAKEGKAPGGYCTGLSEYKMPFIFSNFNGTAADVDVLTHEAGHAFADYVSAREISWSFNRQPSMEGCETHSMSMEFLTSDYHELFFKEDTAKYSKFHTEDALVFIPYGSMVDHFQQIVYSHPEYTPDERCAAWLQLEKQYRPYIDYGDVPAYSRGAIWQRQLHIYLYPFYYIDYCMAQTIALQFFSLYLEDKEKAWEKYMAFVKMGGTETFIGLVKKSGLRSPIDEGSLEKIFKNITNWLDTLK